MPIDLPPSYHPVSIAAARPIGAGAAPRVLLQAVQPPVRVPDTDVVVEVFGELPMQARIQDVSRLLGQRVMNSRGRTYPPTILELITLVERNPARPRGRAWTSIGVLKMGYELRSKQVTVEYCIDYCTADPRTRAYHPKRTVMTYSAPEEVVTARLNKKLADLKKYAKRD